MNAKARKLDIFKLIIALLLLLMLIILITRWQWIKPETQGAQGDISAEENAEVDVEVDAEVDNKDSPEVPSIPASDLTLSLDQDSSTLIDSNGQARFLLDSENFLWMPVVSDEFKSSLLPEFSVVNDESNVWFIRDAAGSVLYTFDIASLEWIEITEDIVPVEKPTEAAPVNVQIVACEGANPTQISGEGAWVEVVNALIPLRSSPSALAPNILRPLPIGTPLEIISLPTCTSYLDGANLWWGVETEGGETGYAAESSAVSPSYYLQEIN